MKKLTWEDKQKQNRSKEPYNNKNHVLISKSNTRKKIKYLLKVNHGSVKNHTSRYLKFNSYGIQ